MGAVITEERPEEKVKYEDAFDLMENNAEEGNWKGQFREKFQEQSEQIEKIKAGMNEEAGFDNISTMQQAQQAQQAQSIINPVTGEIIEIDGYEDELSVATVVSLIEKGASEEEIMAALDEALTSIAGAIAKDKSKAKKYLAELMEVMHVLEITLQRMGKDVELQNSLRQMQENLSKLMKDGNVKQIQEFLKSGQLRQTLSQTIQQTRQNLDVMRLMKTSLQNISRQANQTLLPQNLQKNLQLNPAQLAQLQNLQKLPLQNVALNQLKNTSDLLSNTFKDLSKAYQKENDPARREVLRENINKVTEQAKQVLQLAEQINNQTQAQQAQDSQNFNITASELQALNINAVNNVIEQAQQVNQEAQQELRQETRGTESQEKVANKTEAKEKVKPEQKRKDTRGYDPIDDYRPRVADKKGGPCQPCNGGGNCAACGGGANAKDAVKVLRQDMKSQGEEIAEATVKDIKTATAKEITQLLKTVGSEKPSGKPEVKDGPERQAKANPDVAMGAI